MSNPILRKENDSIYNSVNNKKKILESINYKRIAKLYTENHEIFCVKWWKKKGKIENDRRIKSMFIFVHILIVYDWKEAIHSSVILRAII